MSHTDHLLRQTRAPLGVVPPGIPANIGTFENLPEGVRQRVRTLWQRDRLSIPELAEMLKLPIEWVRRITEEKQLIQGGNRVSQPVSVSVDILVRSAYAHSPCASHPC